MDIIEITKKMKISDFYKNDTVFVLLLIMSAIAFQAGCTTLSANNGQVPPGTKKIVETRYYEPIKQGNDWVCGVEKATSYAYPHSIVYFDEYGNAVLEEIINDEGEVYITTKWDYYDAKRGKLQKKEKHYKYTDEKEIEIYIRDNEGKLLRIEKTQFGKKKVESFEYDNQGRLLKVLKEGKTTRIGYSPENSSTEISYEEVYSEGSAYEKGYKGKKGLSSTKITIKDKITKMILREIEEEYWFGCLYTKMESEFAYNDKGKCVMEKQVGWGRGGWGNDISVEWSADQVKKYFEETYCRKPLKKSRFVTYRYNEYGHLIDYYFSMIFDGNENPVNGSHTFYTRIYNDNGDCIKLTEFEEVTKQSLQKEIEAVYIEIRTITYL